MARGLVGWAVAVGTLASLGWARHAGAEGVLALSYHVPVACPPRSWFQAQVERVASSQPPPVLLEVVPLGQGFAGRVELNEAALPRAARGSTGDTWTRRIEGVSCQDVVSALALSLSIHLEALLAPESGRGASDEPIPGSVRSASFDGASPWRFGIAAAAQMRSGLAPGFDASGGLALLAENGRRGGFSQSYRIGINLAPQRSQPLPPAFGQLAWEHQWWAVGAQGCPWGYGLEPWLYLEPCAGVHGGRYAAAVAGAATHADWFGFAELTARLRAVSGGWAGALELGGSAPFDPLGVERNGEVFYRQRIGFVAGLSLAFTPFVHEIE